jgi:hypothetical protein
MKVAKSELMFSMPIFANIAVSAAKIAESTAHACQDEKRLMGLPALRPQNTSPASILRRGGTLAARLVYKIGTMLS